MSPDAQDSVLDSTTAAEAAKLYATHAERLLWIVAYQVRTSKENVEDACHFAWAQYLTHADQVDPDHISGWLATTAIRNAYRLYTGQTRATSLENELERAVQVPAGRNTCRSPARVADT